MGVCRGVNSAVFFSPSHQPFPSPTRWLLYFDDGPFFSTGFPGLGKREKWSMAEWIPPEVGSSHQSSNLAPFSLILPHFSPLFLGLCFCLFAYSGFRISLIVGPRSPVSQ